MDDNMFRGKTREEIAEMLIEMGALHFCDTPDYMESDIYSFFQEFYEDEDEEFDEELVEEIIPDVIEAAENYFTTHDGKNFLDPK